MSSGQPRQARFRIDSSLPTRIIDLSLTFQLAFYVLFVKDVIVYLSLFQSESGLQLAPTSNAELGSKNNVCITCHPELVSKRSIESVLVMHLKFQRLDYMRQQEHECVRSVYVPLVLVSMVLEISESIQGGGRKHVSRLTSLVRRAPCILV